MVEGLKSFRDYMRGHEQEYILIGGSACELAMRDSMLSFRSTRDLDIVLVAEALRRQFFERFWSFIRAGQYQSLEKTSSKPCLYRFEKPGQVGYPAKIELLSRNMLELPDGVRLSPIPAPEQGESLSAILLDGTYYSYALKSRIEIDGVPTIPAHCLIPLKAKAHLDLKQRRENGDTSVRSNDIKKHRNDVFRLYLTLTPVDEFEIPQGIAEDLKAFLGFFPANSSDWDAIKKSVDFEEFPPPDVVLEQLTGIVRL